MYFLSIGVHILVSIRPFSYHLHTVQNTCIVCVHIPVGPMSCSYHYIQYKTHVFSVHRCSHIRQYTAFFISFTYSTKHVYCMCSHTMSCSYHLHTVQNTRIFSLYVFTYHHPFILTIHLEFPIFIIDKQPVFSTIIIQRDWL